MDENVIKIKWGMMRNNSFTMAMQKLMGVRLEFKASLKFLTILKAVQKEQEKINEMYPILMERNHVLSEDRMHWLPKEGKEKEAIQELREFESQVFSLEVPKLSYSEVEKAGLTPGDLYFLEAFLKEDPSLQIVSSLPASLSPQAPL